jgi:hypothetical protein
MIEKGKTPVTEKNIKLVCVTFNINEQWFRTGIGEMFYASPYERELRDICSQLTPETQQSLLVIVRELLNVQQKLLKASQSEDTPCG